MTTSFLRTSVGKKAIMAVTGLGLLLFVLAHVLGSLKVFVGRDAINDYSQSLLDSPVFLFAARTGLVAFALMHVSLGVLLKLQNRAARPVPYRVKHTVQATTASRTMIWSGLLILAFVLFHLAHFTFRWIGVPKGPLLGHDVYAMVTYGLRIGWIAVVYVAALIALGFHVAHGIGSFPQTLGLTWTGIRGRVLIAAPVIAVVLAAAYAAIPVSIVARLLPRMGW